MKIYLLALVSIVLGAGGQFLLKLGAGGLKSEGGLVKMIGSMLFSPALLIAVFCFVSSMFLWILVLRRMDLSVAYPMVSLGYVIVLLLSWLFLQEMVNGPKMIGTVLIITGVIVINL
ncbi:protein of unknown function DUF6 transmembrane [Syntrophobotulus glycolicus DSM 8271]|uniref:EamA domain-containing protein n=1 Tax=Syntrophobotulus glycolicus (strain DSM 8271 / FlGlyR) TaxID=645991 RepID=F0SVY2_SYNGF|nr:SMR family transporter [Syntrophobotulus glycolicus]ADY56766.1 protein of unknown function DUF6 transmembrane [Syntrophobotulus glycolicus DSM 8271]